MTSWNVKKLDSKQKQLEKETTTTTESTDNKDYRGMFETAFFTCGKVAIPKEDLGAIQRHQRLCSICMEKTDNKKLDEEMFKEGGPEMQHCLSIIETVKKVQQDLLPNSYQYKYTQKKLQQAQELKHELLNHEHARKKESATYIWEQYQKMTPRERRQRYAHEYEDLIDVKTNKEMAFQS